MNVLLKRREIAFYLSDSGARLLAWHGFAEEARPAPEAGAEMIEVEPAAFAARSTSTGRPPLARDRRGRHRGDPLHLGDRQAEGRRADHANLRATPTSPAARVRVASRRRRLGALPLFHSFGQTVSRNAYAGRRDSHPGAEIRPGEALATMSATGHPLLRGADDVRGAAPPPARDYDTSTLRTCITGGASMVEVLRGFEDAFGAIVLEGYGLSETSPVACSNHPDRERRPGSIGRLWKGSRSAWSTRTTTRSPRARSARS